MKVLNTKRVQLLLLLSLLILNKSWMESKKDTIQESTLASLGIEVPTDSKCDRTEFIGTNSPLTNRLAKKSSKLGLVSVGWEMKVYAYKCVTLTLDTDGNVEETQEVRKHYLHVKAKTGSVSDNPNDDTEVCMGCLERAVKFNQFGSSQLITEKSLQEISEALLEVQIEELKQYLANYEKNQKKVELNCTHSWTDEGKGDVQQIKSSEEIQRCRMDRLERYDFVRSKDRYNYFKKYFYNRLKREITSGDEEVLEAARAQLDDLEDMDSSAIRKSVEQLRLLDGYTTEAFRLNRRYQALHNRCQQHYNYFEHTGFSSQVRQRQMEICQNDWLSRYQQGLRGLDLGAQIKFNQLIPPGHSDSLNLRAQSTELFDNIHHRIQTLSKFPTGASRETTGSIVLPQNFSRREADLALGASGLVTNFSLDSKVLPIPASLDRTVQVQGVFR